MRTAPLRDQVLARVVLRLILAVAISAHVGHGRSKHRRATVHRLSDSQTHITVAKGFIKAGRLSEALDSFQRAIESHQSPSLSSDGFNERRDPHFMKGLVLRELGRHPEAVDALLGAVDAMPSGFPEPHTSLCATMFAQFQLQLAAEQGVQTLANDTFLVDNVIGHCNTAIAATAPSGTRWQGSQKKAIAHAHRTKAQILSSLGRMGEARLSSASALRLNANHRPLAAELAAAVPALVAHGTLHKLWPTRSGSEQHGPNGPDPFGLVSAVPGSNPAQKPWYLPIYVSQMDPSPDLSKMNDGLVSVVSHLRAQDAVGVTVSNVGGWQSQTGNTNNFEDAEAGSFLRTKLGGDHGISAVNKLRAVILHQVYDMLTMMKIVPHASSFGEPSTTYDAGPKYRAPHISIAQSWANVNGKGNSNVIHNHGTATFSGCYYVQSGYLEGDASMQNATALLFNNPWKPNGEEWSDSALGRPGTLALWPGHLGHRVPAHLGSIERISIAFNVELTLGGEDESSASGSILSATEDQHFAQSDRPDRTSLASWDFAAVSEWLGSLGLPAVAQAARAAELDGATVLNMKKAEWKALGASGLQSAKIVAAVSKLR